MRVLIAIACASGLAFASTFGAERNYDVIGYSDDSKHVYFRKTTSEMFDNEEWLAVYDGTTTKMKKSVPVYRSCGDGDMECPKGSITKKVGEKTAAKIHATFGKPNASTLLAEKSKTGDELKDGFTQEFASATVNVRAETKIVGKLPEAIAHPWPTAQFEVKLTVTANGGTWIATQKIRVATIDNSDNAHVREWPVFGVQGLATAPDLRSVAIVFGHKPYVIKLTKS